MRISVTGIRKSKSFAIVTLVFLAAMGAVALVAAITRRNEDIRCAGTSEALASDRKDIYAVICRGTGTRETRDLAFEIFEERDVKAVFFINDSTDVNTAKAVLSHGHALGVDCSGTRGMNKSEFLRWLAAQNDFLFASTGRRPRFCCADGDACLYAREVCKTYGQFCVNAAEIINAGYAEIERGGVVLCSLKNANTLYAFAQAAERAAARGIYPAGLYELFEEYGGVFIARYGRIYWENYLQNAQGVLK